MIFFFHFPKNKIQVVQIFVQSQKVHASVLSAIRCIVYEVSCNKNAAEGFKACDLKCTKKCNETKGRTKTKKKKPLVNTEQSTVLKGQKVCSYCPHKDHSSIRYFGLSQSCQKVVGKFWYCFILVFFFSDLRPSNPKVFFSQSDTVMPQSCFPSETVLPQIWSEGIFSWNFNVS